LSRSVAFLRMTIILNGVLQVFSAHGVDVHVLDPLRPTFREIVNESSL
jgi:hypothetical protein